MVDGREAAIAFGLASVHLLNDLVAIAHSISVLLPDELGLLQEGRPNLSGNAGLVAAGTGLGESYLFNDGRRLVPAPSEAGHSDFAARTPRELELSAWLIARDGRPELEQVVSGIGLRNLYNFAHPVPCEDIEGASEPVDVPALISRKAFAGTCRYCMEALELFVSAYGAECGNLALRAVTTRGLYMGGGIAPKILPALQTGLFLNSFCAKPPMEDLLASIPVKVILNPQAGLLGASGVRRERGGHGQFARPSLRGRASRDFGTLSRSRRVEAARFGHQLLDRVDVTRYQSREVLVPRRRDYNHVLETDVDVIFRHGECGLYGKDHARLERFESACSRRALPSPRSGQARCACWCGAAPRSAPPPAGASGSRNSRMPRCGPSSSWRPAGCREAWRSGESTSIRAVYIFKYTPYSSRCTGEKRPEAGNMRVTSDE